MDAYSYDPVTGEYKGTVVRQKDPLASQAQGVDVYLMPAHATDVTPPPSGANQIAVFESGTWVIEQDHRGQTWYAAHGQPVVIHTIGGPSENGLFLVEPDAPLPTQEELQAYAAQKRYEVEIGGITVAGIKVPTDDRAKTLIEGGANSLADTDEIDFLAPGIGWVKLTGAQIRVIQSTIAAHVQACFSINKIVSDKITNSAITTIVQIDAESWPTNS